MRFISNKFLDILIGEKLSSVTFVMDYLQLDFDGNRLTLNIWPVITNNGKESKFEELAYRDNLCSLITQVVKEASIKENESLIIKFEKGDKIFISLDPNNPELITPEILDFTDTSGSLYIL